MEISDSLIFISSFHICTSDSSNQIRFSCTGISEFNYSGDLLDKQLLDTFTPEGFNRLILSNHQLYLTGHLRQSISGRPTILLKLNDYLGIDSVFEYTSNPGEAPNNEGIIELNNSFYLYGYKLIYSQNKSYSHIIKIDNHTKIETWEKTYARADRDNACYDLQPTTDGNLIFIHHFSDSIGAGGESGFQILKIDTSGAALDSFEFEDIGIDNPRLLAGKEGDIYFTSQDPPYPHTIPTNGRINKLNSNLKDLEWSLELPSNPFIDAHRYKIYDYIQAANGDIVACGSVWDEGPDGPIGTSLNHTWNGFIVRVSRQGEIIWIHEYRQPNTHPNLPHDQYGDFRGSTLSKIYETKDGKLIAGGSVYYNGDQIIGLLPDENQSDIWLMLMDQSGCIQSEECTRTIILNGINDDGNVNFLSPEKTWIEGYFNSSWWSYKYKFDSLPVILHGKSYFQLLKAYSEVSEIWEATGTFIRELNDRVYEYTGGFDQIIYDFNLMEGDTFHLGDSSYPKDLLVTKTDTVALLNGVLKKRLILEAIDPSGEVIASDIVWIEGIGNLSGLFTNYTPWSADWDPSYILCVRWNDDVVYDNPDIESCWMMTTSVRNPMDIIQPVYPNPTSGIIHISDTENGVPYELFDLQGMNTQSGISGNGEIRIEQQGVFILRLFQNSKWINRRVVVMY